MVDIVTAIEQPAFDLAGFADDGTYTIAKLKAASDSLGRFNDALMRIGEMEADASCLTPDQPRARPASAGSSPSKSGR